MFLDVFAIHKRIAQVAILDSKVAIVIISPSVRISPYLSYAIINVKIIEAIMPTASIILASTIKVTSSLLHDSNTKFPFFTCFSFTNAD